MGNVLESTLPTKGDFPKSARFIDGAAERDIHLTAI
jgi:hypothetical protein